MKINFWFIIANLINGQVLVLSCLAVTTKGNQASIFLINYTITVSLQIQVSMLPLSNWQHLRHCHCCCCFCCCWYLCKRYCWNHLMLVNFIKKFYFIKKQTKKKPITTQETVKDFILHVNSTVRFRYDFKVLCFSFILVIKQCYYDTFFLLLLRPW